MLVECRRCGHRMQYSRGYGKQMRCKVCRASVTRRMEVTK